MDELIVTEEMWPHGLRCMDCNARIAEGTAYSKRLVGIASRESDASYPVVEIVCVPCGLGLTSCR